MSRLPKPKTSFKNSIAPHLSLRSGTLPCRWVLASHLSCLVSERRVIFHDSWRAEFAPRKEYRYVYTAQGIYSPVHGFRETCPPHAGEIKCRFHPRNSAKVLVPNLRMGRKGWEKCFRQSCTPMSLLNSQMPSTLSTEPLSLIKQEVRDH